MFPSACDSIFNNISNNDRIAFLEERVRAVFRLSQTCTRPLEQKIRIQ